MDIKDLLAGYNCGGCGYENCEECAKAIISEKLDPSVCMLLEEENAEKIRQILKNTQDNKN